MIIALAEVARSSRTAVQPLDRTEAHHWTMQSRKLRLTDGLELGTLKILSELVKGWIPAQVGRDLPAARDLLTKFAICGAKQPESLLVIEGAIIREDETLANTRFRLRL